MKTRFPAILVAGVLSAASATADAAQVALLQDNGFYGGVSLRQSGSDGTGVTFGHLANEWVRFAPLASEDSGARTMMFGGYRLRSDLAVEAAVGTGERYSLHRTDALGRSGVGLALPGFVQEAPARSWNVDVYGTWAFWRSFSLYGRMGYAQPDVTALPSDVRRSREGVNYGLGLRYDMTRSFGLRLEYARFGHLFGESIGTSIPESDQVQFGLQYRF